MFPFTRKEVLFMKKIWNKPAITELKVNLTKRISISGTRLV